MEHVTCILIDDDLLALERMVGLIQIVGNTEILAKIDKPWSSISQVVDLKPDLLFLDVEMPGMSGLDLLKEIHKKNCYPGVIFVTGFDHYAIKAIKAEAFDYLVKPVDIDELKTSIQRFVEKKQLNGLTGYENLSAREKEIMQLVVQGKTSREIADILFISKHTVDTHRRNISKKTIRKSY